jgi:hypothetical protein
MLTAPSQAPQRRGNTQYGNGTLPSGTTTVVAGGANPRGIIVRTAIIGAVGGSNTSIETTGAPFCIVTGANYFTYNGPGYLIPPGLPLLVISSSAGGSVNMSYDLL